MFHRLVAEGTLPDGIACDDFAAVHLIGTELSEVVSSRTPAGAYRIVRGADGEAHESPLPVKRLVDEGRG